MNYLIGLDSGLTVTKAVLFQTDGIPVSVARQRVKQWQPREHFVERDMHDLWSACAQVIRQVINESGVDVRNIVGISQTAHGDGLYLLDKSKAPLGRGIVSLDSRARQIVDQWSRTGVCQQSLALCGQEPGVSSPVAILAWIKRNDPEKYSSIGSMFSCKDWIRFKLTNEIATDRTEASTAFTNVSSQEISSEVLELFNLTELQDCLPPAIGSSDLAGSVTDQAAEETGLVAGTPVAAGLHDVCASAMGIGAHKIHTLSIITGTYSINQIVSNSPKLNSNWFCRNAVEPGLWNNMAISPASSANFDWYVRSLLQHGDNEHPKRAAESAVALRSCKNALLFHPFLYGSPYPAPASASLIGLGSWHNQTDVTAAILEGIIFNHCVHVEHLSQELDYNRVYLTGGISRNEAVAQHFSDALGCPIIVPQLEEAACWGAAICAGIATNYFDNSAEMAAKDVAETIEYVPDTTKTAVVKNRFEVYKKTVESIRGIWTELEALGDQESSL